MSAYVSPMVLKQGDLVLSRGCWWTLTRVNHVEDGTTLVRMERDMETGHIGFTVDLDSSALFLTAEPGEAVQLDMFAQVQS